MDISYSNCYLLDDNSYKYYSESLTNGILSLANIIINNENYKLCIIREFYFDFRKYNFKLPKDIIKVPQNLDLIIYSSMSYPPSFALSLILLNEQYVSISSFFSDLLEKIRIGLENQYIDKYFMVKAYRSQDNIYSGIYYWVVDYKADSDKLVIVDSWNYKLYYIKRDVFDLGDKNIINWFI